MRKFIIILLALASFSGYSQRQKQLGQPGLRYYIPSLISDTIRMNRLAIASNSDSAIVWDRSTNLYKYAKINGSTTPTLEQVLTSGSTLTNPHTWAVGSNTQTFTGTQTSNAVITITNTGNGDALSMSSTGSGPTTLISNTSSGNGLQITASNGVGLNVTSDNNTAGTFSINPTSTNTTATVASFTRRTTGTAANNIGASAAFQLEDDAGNTYEASQIKTIATDAAAATRTTSVVISNINNTTSNDRWAVMGSGQIREYAYGQNTFSVTPATTPVYSSNGTKGERIAPKIYTALLSATAGNAPTATVLGTNEIGTIVWTRNSAGNYTGTLSGAFTANKTWAITQRGDMSGNFVNGWISSGSVNTVTLIVQDNAGGAVDAFTNMSIRIEVYP